MDNLFVALFEILSFGAIVVLVVLGLGIIASMMGIFNFAQGEFVLLGAYVTYIVHSAGLPVWLGMLAAPFVVGALGLVLERTIVRRFYAAPIVAIRKAQSIPAAAKSPWRLGLTLRRRRLSPPLGPKR